ncbi:MAG TPA: iron-sulfur cluster repair di-iron protein, ric [Porphyromonadaceae bacterium]|nr:iron-sulfur cluster repair di-iron protein, ric [Porphyromonadaceae bacterium]
MKTKFNEIRESELQKLGFILPVVKRVHGGSHPEIFEVAKVFDQMSNKTEKAGSKTPQLGEEFNQLREITNNYTVPGGVCESYAAMFKILEKMDNAYNN